MKKKAVPYILLITALVAGIFLLRGYFMPKGSTVAEREDLLNKAISSGTNWKIATETEMEDYLISAAYSTNGRITLAIFKPSPLGGHQFQTSTNRNQGEIITSGVTIGDTYYDLIWFNGAQTQYAELQYTIDGKKQDAIKYDTTNMDIICHQNSAKEYEMSVAYYDSDGNKYE